MVVSTNGFENPRAAFGGSFLFEIVNSRQSGGRKFLIVDSMLGGCEVSLSHAQRSWRRMQEL